MAPSTMRASEPASWTPASVLLITPRWARDGGVGAHVQASAGVLAGAGIPVSVLAARIESERRLPGVTLLHRPELLRAETSMDARLGDALEREPTVVHLHQVDDPDVVQAVRASAPAVVSAHGYTACTSGVHYFRPGHECARPHGPGCVPNLLACAHSRNPAAMPAKYKHASRGLEALRGADMAVSYSSSVDRHLAANGVAHRIVVPYFPTMPPSAAAPGPASRRVVFAGRIVPAKGVEVLIRAAAEVDGEFMICGDGRQLQAMRRLVERRRLQHRVHFTGWLAADALAEQLASASVVVIPSVWPEPFGLVGIEAMAAGKPVIASATGGVGDWLDAGVSGLSVPPGDPSALAGALEELLADPDRQVAMGAAGRSSVQARFSAERHLSVLLEGYRVARSTWQARANADQHLVAPPMAPAAVG